MKEERLDKFVAMGLKLTRNEAKNLIKNKKIKINGEIIRDGSYKVKESDVVLCDDTIVKFEENIYLMMNKPKGYVCSTDDKNNKTILELISDYNINKLMIVGRLDIDTTGLIILTSDGAFVHKLTSPNKNINKKYEVLCDKDFTEDDINKFKEGITIYLDDETPYKCKSSELEILKNKKEAYITISEGKYHQIKKMCKMVDKKVYELKRVEIGKLKLDCNLLPGEYRKLTNEEMELIK